MIACPIETINAVIDDINLKSDVLEIDFQQVTDVGIILYHQYSPGIGLNITGGLVLPAAGLLMLIQEVLQVVVQA
jgi:hypothetical protein